MFSRLLVWLKDKLRPAEQVEPEYVSEPDYDYCVNLLICIATED